MTEALLTYRGTVYPWHCDHVGHMNVMWYVGKFDEASWQLFNALGLSRAYLRSAQRGMAAVDQHISYLQELHAGAVVCVRSRVLEDQGAQHPLRARDGRRDQRQRWPRAPR